MPGQDAIQQTINQFILFLPSLISAIVIFILTLIFAGLLSRLIRRGMERRKADPEVALLVTKIAYWSFLVLGIITALQQINFNLTAFLTGVGVVGFTIGFALQDVSKNFVSGILLLLQQPFDIGDAIEVAGIGGTVVSIDLRATLLHAFDGKVVMIPNADIFTSPITNYSRANVRRVDLNVGVSYDSDLERVRKTALRAVAPISGLCVEPTPQVFFQNFGSSTIDVLVRYWIDTSQTDPLSATDAGLVAVKTAFEQAGIDIPYPIQTVRLHQNGGSG
jgi:small conductance mechanosensitive channel